MRVAPHRFDRTAHFLIFKKKTDEDPETTPMDPVPHVRSILKTVRREIERHGSAASALYAYDDTSIGAFLVTYVLDKRRRRPRKGSQR